MSSNYRRLFDGELKKIKGKRPRLLLHVCCGPCSEYPLVLLNEYFQITIYYGNSNIYPFSEFELRLSELERYLNIIEADIKLVIAPYETSYQDELKTFGPIKEGGKRCEYCYQRRMHDAYSYAEENNFDYFTTVMSISERKNADYIDRIGSDLEKLFPKVKYLHADFKKDGGSTINHSMNKVIGLYEQDYCGCIYTYKVHLSKLKDTSTS